MLSSLAPEDELPKRLSPAANNLARGIIALDLVHQGISKVCSRTMTASEMRPALITQETVEMEVLIASMLIPADAKELNMVPAMPGRSRKSGPNMETIPTSGLWITSFAPN
jgi:hypothetical protein